LLTMAEIKLALRDLDDAISRGTPESRTRALRYATDLLLGGRYREDDVSAFGEIISRLADEIELVARADLANRLARFDKAPTNIIRKLAFDQAIEVAGPVLSQSVRLDNDTLVANARTMSQAHLLAISQRKALDTIVTDVLVTRGDRSVANALATNEGARLSDFGFLHLVKRAEGDSILAENLGLRTDIPRQVFQQLIAKASEDVKRRLVDERPAEFAQVEASVADVAGRLQSKFGPASRSFFVAKRVVATQHQLGHLNEASIAGYAAAHKFDEVVVGLSLLCSLPSDVVERALFDKERDMLLVLAKSLDFCWNTTMSLLFLGATSHCITASELWGLEGDFSALNVKTSRSILEHYRSRNVVGAPDTDVQHRAQAAH